MASDLRIELRDPHSLRPYEGNAKKHPEAQLAKLKAAILEFGFCQPIGINGDGGVLTGHARLQAALELGQKRVPVVVLDHLSEKQQRAYIIADNRIAELGEWDPEQLARELEKVTADGFQLDVIGFTDVELERLEGNGAGVEIVSSSGRKDPGAKAPPERPVSRLGDLWHLGRHRLLCGDSTKNEDLDRLMGSERAVLLATEPPYLVNYQETNHPQDWTQKFSRSSGKLKHKPPPKNRGKQPEKEHWDNFDPKHALEFFSTYLRVCLAHCIERVPVYQWHASRRQKTVEEAWDANGLLAHQTVIWLKSSPILTRCDYMWIFEPCLYGWPRGMRPEKNRRPPAGERNCWPIEHLSENEGTHLTQKPVEVFERPLRYHTRKGEIVLEPFSGSGTQIIAAEHLGRVCRALELAPGYVDVAIRRWQEFTGEEATLDGKKGFSRIDEERARAPRAPAKKKATKKKLAAAKR